MILEQRECLLYPRTMSNKVQIQIVTWNSRKHLERLFRGIEKQRGIDFRVLIIDNNSSDGTVEWIEKYPDEELASSSGFRSTSLSGRQEFGMTVIKNNENAGFAKAHNQGFALCEAPYVLALNPDTELQEGFLEQVVKTMESYDQIASVGGMLYRQLPSQEKSGIIDSCGLKMRLNGQIVDIGQNSSQNANFSLKKDVFGVSGACVLYRLNALKQVKDKYGIFDERFGTYKEDVDLAWRLNRAKFKAKINPKAVAWHEREFGKTDRKNQPNRVKQLSIQNHLMMLKKNLSWFDWHRFPFILGYEMAKFIYVLLFERQSLWAYFKNTKNQTPNTK